MKRLRLRTATGLSEEPERDSAAAGVRYIQQCVVLLFVYSSQEAEGTPLGFAHLVRRWAHGREELLELKQMNHPEGVARVPRVRGPSVGAGSSSACLRAEEGLPGDAEGGQEVLATGEATESCQDRPHP